MKQEPAKGRREEILAAAARCLAQHGYAKTTMEDVGREVGLNKASLYYYFKSKEHLVSEVIGSESAEYMQALKGQVERVSGCANKITTYLVERFRAFQRVVNLHNLSVQDMRRVGPQMKKLFAAVKHQELKYLGSILRHCVDRGEIRACDTDRLAAAILTVAEGFKMEHLVSPDTPQDAAVDYSGIEGEVVFTVRLMLEGLKQAPREG